MRSLVLCPKFGDGLISNGFTWPDAVFEHNPLNDLRADGLARKSTATFSWLTSST